VLLVIYPHLLCPHIWATEILDNSIFAGQKRDQASKTPDSLLLLRLVGNHQGSGDSRIFALPDLTG